VLPADTTGQQAEAEAVLFLIDHSQLLQEHLMQLQLVKALDNTILVGQVLGVPLLLQQTVRTLCFQLSLPVAVVVADRGSQVRHLRWTTEELADVVVPVVAVALILETVLTVDREIMAVWELMGKDTLEVQVLDLMRIQKTHTKVVVVVVLVVRELVLLMVVSVIVRPLEAIKLPVDPEQQLIY
jgi:hypothetical protein